MDNTFISATILLLLITDPLGGVPVFVNALRGVAPKRRPKIILREVSIAFIILLMFMLGGHRFLEMFQLSDLSLQLAGGIILFLIAMRMVFPAASSHGSQDDVLPEEPLIVPLAVPMLAGPSAMATVMLMVSQAPDRKLEWIAALAVTMTVCAVVLLLSGQMQRLLGDSVLKAFERLMGLILVVLAVEMILKSLRIFIQSLS